MNEDNKNYYRATMLAIAYTSLIASEKFMTEKEFFETYDKEFQKFLSLAINQE